MVLNYLLDTNAVSRIVGRRESLVQARFLRTPPETVAICAIVEAELRYGADKSASPERNHSLLDVFISRVPVLPFDREAAREYGRLRLTLEREGQIIGPNDLLIAAIALAHGLRLVTHNTAEFRRVPGLSVEDWERAT